MMFRHYLLNFIELLQIVFVLFTVHPKKSGFKIFPMKLTTSSASKTPTCTQRFQKQFELSHLKYLSLSFQLKICILAPKMIDSYFWKHLNFGAKK